MSLGHFDVVTVLAAQPSRDDGAILQQEFVFDTLPVPSVHASTIVPIPDGILVAWFGGSYEGADDVGIWASRLEAGAWTEPDEIARGIGPDGSRTPSWNPVLFEDSRGVINLFYKAGPSPQRWWGMKQMSNDGGRSWSAAERLPDGILGPIKNKPMILPDGTIVSGSSTESTNDPSDWRVHFERSVDEGRTWTTATPPKQQIDAIQPSILVHEDGRLQAIGRTRSERIFETWSADGGVHWSELALTTLPNPNSGTDAVTLQDGRHLIVYNHTPTGRSPLNVAISRDGALWEAALVLEDEPGQEYSYPSVIQSADGLVHITYTWKRERIRHVVVDPALLRPIPMPSGQWPVDSPTIAFQQEIVAELSGYPTTPLIDPQEGPFIRSSPEERARAASWLVDKMGELRLPPQRHDYRLPNTNGFVDLLLPPYRGSNVYTVIEATRPNAPYVVVGAHYDSDPGSPGAGDNASGVAVVLSLARGLNQLESRGVNFILVCFDQEEDDEVGSRAFVRYLRETYPDIHSAHITDLSGWDDDGDGVVEIQSPGPLLERLYRQASDRVQVPVRFTEGASSDNKSFLAADIRTAGVFGDITVDLHKPSDTWEKVDFGFMERMTALLFDVLSHISVDGGSDAP